MHTQGGGVTVFMVLLCMYRRVMYFESDFCICMFVLLYSVMHVPQQILKLISHLMSFLGVHAHVFSYH